VAHLASRLQARQSVESVIARDGRLVGIPVLRLGEARAVALGDSPATRGLLTATAGSGSVWQVVGPMETTMASDTLPFDATDSLAGAPPAEVHHRTFGEWLAAGRFFIWPILATLALGSGFALWRFLRLSTQAVDPRLTVQVTAALDRGDVEGAQALVALRRSPLARVLAAGLAVIERDRDAREAALSQALIAEQPRLQAGLALILVLAGIAPLLGLLGTVTGMIDLFAVIAQQGSGNAKSLSGAISEALTTTQAGMIAAIPLLLVHAVLGRIAERRMLGLEAAAMGLIGIHLETRQVETTRSAS
jgi:biopolymer transport protein ExbB